jgi:hypothetical protein
MIELQKDDIPVLNYIINELSKPEVYYITAEYLAEKKVFGFGQKKTIDDLVLKTEDENNFEIIAEIIFQSRKAEVKPQSFENPLSISKNSETLLFKRQGGFGELFKKQNRKPKLSLFELLSILGFTVTFFYGFYQNEKSKTLENKSYKYLLELDSLKVKFQSLNIKTDSLVYELKKAK